ncbi:MAG: DNA helicase PcrA [Acetilactobacillus jinshanensis]
MAKSKILSGLNSKQREAVLCTKGPLLIMAGAGSGKTRVLTRRIAYLIRECGVNPWNVLAITFTNKAAREMRDRVTKLLNGHSRGVWVSTFHALCMRILRLNAERINYSRAFTIAGPSEQRTLVKHILTRDLNVDPKRVNPRAVLSSISMAKNNLQTAAEYKAVQDKAHNPFTKTVGKVYARYQQELHQNQAMDFDDLIMLTIILFKKFPDVLRYYQEKFRYVSVDEYQDTNEAQYQLIHLLGQRYQNVCVVGDADQSIYGWRGANMNNILDFQDDYPHAHVVLLEENYRSTKNILDAANSVIKHNEGRKDKNLWTRNPTGAKVSYYRGQSAEDESHFVVAKIIEDVKKHHASYNDFAILYRTNAQSRVIEETFLKSNVPYTIIGGNKFYDRKEIQDILAYLTLLANPSDSISLQRIINVPKRGIGQASVSKLTDFANENHWSLLEATRHLDLANQISTRAKNSIGRFGTLISKLRQQMPKLNVTDLTKQVLDKTGYLPTLKASNSLEAKARIENIEEFISVTLQFDKSHHEVPLKERLTNFLADLSLVSAQDDVDDSKPQVTLMTLHAAKGLEFPVVFIIGMEEGIFPLASAMGNQSELEEERRLAYVGITRAKKKLYLTNAYSRMLYGRFQSNPPSRFVKEIDPSLLQKIDDDQIGSEPGFRKHYFRTPFDRHRDRMAFKQPYRSAKVEKPKETGADQKSWHVGDRVKHRAWGVGTVIKVNGHGEDMELDIAFPDRGIKRLLAAFAPIHKVK